MHRAFKPLTYLIVVLAAAEPAAEAAEPAAKPAEPAAKPAEPAAGPTNDDCMACHNDPATTRADGKPVIVDEAKWKGSIHGEVSVACVDCHADLATAELPHAEKLKPAQCGSCHEKVVPELAASVHGKPRPDGKGPTAACTGCHGDGHHILASGDRRSPTNQFNLVDTCAKCHADTKLMASVKLPSGIVASYQDTIHGRGVREAGLTVAPTCSACHGAHGVRSKDDPESRVNRLKQAAMCGKCHEGIQEKYDVSVHAAKVRGGDKAAPVCASCHTAHKIQRSDLATWELDVISECGICHQEALLSYRDTFHGRVTSLGFARIAKCADCHGAHDIVARTDPKSPVVGENRIATCKRCHPAASPSLAKYDPHPNLSDKKRSRPLYYAGLLMKVLLFGVFGFFGLHTLLWLWRLSIDASARHPGGKEGE